MNKLAVFFTVYDRFENLERSINLFKMQTDKRFDLFIVNNSNRNIEDLVDIDCEIIDMGNKYNIYGRFFAVREVLDRGYEIIAFMDDDAVFGAKYISDCYRYFEPQYVKSFWAFEIATDYWIRKRLRGSTNGHYCGAGGLLAPADLFRVPQLYQCPKEYWIMDDIWMSHVVLAHTDYKIRFFPTPVNFIDDHKATYKKIKPLKSEMAKKYILPYK